MGSIRYILDTLGGVEAQIIYAVGKHSHNFKHLPGWGTSYRNLNTILDSTDLIIRF